MSTRRSFLKRSTFAGLLASPSNLFRSASAGAATKPVVISTWNFGLAANEAAWGILSKGGRALDAVEAGARVPESDPRVDSVGYGGLPDREGRVTLDACIMDEQSRCGSVAFLQGIKHPVSVARMVMERTPHVMLAGEGARRFALANGFEEENLLTPEAERAWREWLAVNPTFKPKIDAGNHDTIGILALDAEGNLSGACTTSGLAFKMHGRVGDSPIIGAGLYVDNEVGAATATGVGEMVIRIAGSHLVVELMRQGNSPTDACRLAIERLVRKNANYQNVEVGFLALDREGRHGAYATGMGFEFALYTDAGGNRLIKSPGKL